MSYTKHTWLAGEIIEASKINNIENGISNIDTQISGISDTVDSIDELINDTNGIVSLISTINTNVSNIDTLINGTNGIVSLISDIEDDIDSILNTLLNSIKFGGIFFTAQDIPTEPYFSAVIGRICYILDDNGTYKVLSGDSDTSRSIDIYCYQNVDSAFYSCQLIPPSSTHIFVAFIPNSTINDYGNLVFSGEISNTTIDIEDSTESSDGTGATATTVLGRLISGIGNILFTYNPTQLV